MDSRILVKSQEGAEKSQSEVFSLILQRVKSPKPKIIGSQNNGKKEFEEKNNGKQKKDSWDKRKPGRERPGRVIPTHPGRGLGSVFLEIRRARNSGS